jgi:hypothetical protein
MGQTTKTADNQAKRAAELTHTTYELEYLPISAVETKKVILKMGKEQQILYDTICNSKVSQC